MPNSASKMAFLAIFEIGRFFLLWAVLAAISTEQIFDDNKSFISHHNEEQILVALFDRMKNKGFRFCDLTSETSISLVLFGLLHRPLDIGQNRDNF